MIPAAEEYQPLRQLDRQALSIHELSEANIAAIAAAEIPAEQRYCSNDLG